MRSRIVFCIQSGHAASSILGIRAITQGVAYPKSSPKQQHPVLIFWMREECYSRDPRLYFVYNLARGLASSLIVAELWRPATASCLDPLTDLDLANRRTLASPDASRLKVNGNSRLCQRCRLPAREAAHTDGMGMGWPCYAIGQQALFSQPLHPPCFDHWRLGWRAGRHRLLGTLICCGLLWLCSCGTRAPRAQVVSWARCCPHQPFSSASAPGL